MTESVWAEFMRHPGVYGFLALVWVGIAVALGYGFASENEAAKRAGRPVPNPAPLLAGFGVLGMVTAFLVGVPALVIWIESFRVR